MGPSITMAKRETKKFFIRGVARYPKTDKPYSFDKAAKKSVPDEDGKLQIEVIVPANVAEGYEKVIAEFVTEQGKKVSKLKNVPYQPEVDRDTDEETGNVVFKAWQYGKSKDGKVRKMGHFDGKGKPLPSDFRLTSGSEVIIAVRANLYNELGGGVNLYLDGVQVVKYREFDHNPGFGAVEGGYEADDEDEDVSGSDEDTTDETSEAPDTDF